MYIKLIIWGIVCSFVLAIAGSAYMYYKSSQAAIAELNKQVASYAIAVEQQAQSISFLENAIKEQAQARKQLAKEVDSARKDVEKIQSTIANHNFGHIASRKASLLEKKINQGTVDILRCFEIVTGDKVLPNEKNPQCNDLLISADGLRTE